MSSKPKLTYFVSEGRGEPIRLAFLLGGVDFEDNRINYPDWPAVKNSTPWGTLPILEIDGKVLGESNTILRFVGKRTNVLSLSLSLFIVDIASVSPSCMNNLTVLTADQLYPTDDWEAAKADEIMDAVEDVATAIGPTLRMPEAEKLAARQKLAETTIPFYLERLEKQLRAAGGKYFAGGKLSVADLKGIDSLITCDQDFECRSSLCHSGCSSAVAEQRHTGRHSRVDHRQVHGAERSARAHREPAQGPGMARQARQEVKSSLACTRAPGR
jgi:glutathione S-transferase